MITKAQIIAYGLSASLTAGTVSGAVYTYQKAQEPKNNVSTITGEKLLDNSINDIDEQLKTLDTEHERAPFFEDTKNNNTDNVINAENELKTEQKKEKKQKETIVNYPSLK